MGGGVGDGERKGREGKTRKEKEAQSSEVEQKFHLAPSQTQVWF